METFDCFAYGSNMLAERLIARCPNAIALGSAKVKDFRLSFSKISDDGSGKATLIEAAGQDTEVHGVLFRIPLTELADLDSAEGVGNGYLRRDRIAVTRSADGAIVLSTIYVAEQSARDENLCPYDWYRDLVLAGAIQNHLPMPHIDILRSLSVKADPKPNRRRRLEALRVLRQAGNPHLGSNT